MTCLWYVWQKCNLEGDVCIIVYIYRIYLHVEVMKKNSKHCAPIYSFFTNKILIEMWKQLGAGNILSILNLCIK